MENRKIENSELVLTEDGRVYHLKLLPPDIADIIFLVGDPGRVSLMSSLFDKVDTAIENREFITHTGRFKDKRFTVMSTGIGTDNMDIAINELDALVNIDLEERKIKDELSSLTLIRIGTSGALHPGIEPGDVIISSLSGGLDNLAQYYKYSPSLYEEDLSTAFCKHMGWGDRHHHPYFVRASEKLSDHIYREGYRKGITLSAPGFYGPQGRVLRIPLDDDNYIEKIQSFRFGDLRINNFEMEGSALYGLSGMLGHDALTVCIALANRATGRFATSYSHYMEKLLDDLLNRMCEYDEKS